jgi:murein DD-endopeptidase MepM/ murein hydrolase activator NlpD
LFRFGGSTVPIGRGYDRKVNAASLRCAGRMAMRIGSLRNIVIVTAGMLLSLSPVDSGPSAGVTASLLPYIPGYAHQAYGYALALTRLRGNAPAREWLAAADRAVLSPQDVTLPFRGSGRLASAGAAMGYAFEVPAGRRLRIDVDAEAAEPRELFVDLFRVNGSRLERVTGASPRARGPESQSRPLEIEALDGGTYVLRVQPELEAILDYQVAMADSPLLSFPVEGHDARAIWSGFGAERDGGRRAHRGVDIFANRGTRALAAVDGWVMRVETTRVGGNVVWIQPLFGNMRLYYAHLDQQWVERGQFVLAGEPIGTVGNTGNAITTPPHLHFGVYVRQPGVRGGARDPATFLR